MTENVTLRAEGLTKVFGAGRTAVKAVDNVFLNVRQGALVLIMGPSGSGKTTLLSMLGGLLRPTSGLVFINGAEITAMNEAHLPELRAREIGFIFQAFNLLSSFNVEENVLFPATLVHGNARAARSRCDELLERLGLVPRRLHVPRDLSGGEKQRVAIARALINNPKLVLADEPTGNLDSRTGHEVMMILHDIARDEGRTVLMVTHDSRLEDMADSILWLEDGKLQDRKNEAHEWTSDAVCGMKVDRWTATFFVDYNDVRHFFCSERCVERFQQAPDMYLEKRKGNAVGQERAL